MVIETYEVSERTAQHTNHSRGRRSTRREHHAQSSKSTRSALPRMNERTYPPRKHTLLARRYTTKLEHDATMSANNRSGHIPSVSPPLSSIADRRGRCCCHRHSPRCRPAWPVEKCDCTVQNTAPQGQRAERTSCQFFQRSHAAWRGHTRGQPFPAGRPAAQSPVMRPNQFPASDGGVAPEAKRPRKEVRSSCGKSAAVFLGRTRPDQFSSGGPRT